MPVFLRRSSDLAGIPIDYSWIATTGSHAPVERPNRLANAARLLDTHFSAIRDDWWELARTLGQSPSAELGHAPTASSYSSDLGVMMTWERIVIEAAGKSTPLLVICDDPWLFRHFAGMTGVTAGAAPSLMRETLKLRIRGMAARLKYAFRAAYAALALRGDRRKYTGTGAPALLVYGHPGSNADGNDAYFGDLMNEIPGLRRMLHVDCGVARARELAGERTMSFHGWGSALRAAGLVFAKWRPSAQDKSGRYGWLVRRAAEREGGAAAAAATRWQSICQAAWLAQTKPAAIAWPWESHPWERALIRSAHDHGVKTAGYQHTVVGKHLYNYGTAANSNGLDGIPDTVLCNGPSYRDQLETWGVPADRLLVAGAFRLPVPRALKFDPAAPVFVALSSDPVISTQMLLAIRQAVSNAGEAKRRFLLKEHPLYPFPFEPGPGIERTEVELTKHAALSAVLYATGTVGLEAVMAGLPTIRFLPEGKVAIDILPLNITVPTAEAIELNDVLTAAEPQNSIRREDIIAPVDMAYWRNCLGTT
ncbi:MAG: hypothetical protein HOK82_20710 [Rhodospirillaceae bacterium]|jgi:hypothetical protein|nr:hypothetical protein [Rhodospirillaceae bacterium]